MKIQNCSKILKIEEMTNDHDKWLQFRGMGIGGRAMVAYPLRLRSTSRATGPRRLCLTMASKCGGKPLRTKVVMIWDGHGSN